MYIFPQQPLIPRDSSRLLVVYRDKDKIEHRRFYEVVEFLQEGDLLVLNNTRVIPARLKGRKKERGGKVEIFLLQKKGMSSWECLLRPAKKIKEGTQIYFSQTNYIRDGLVLSLCLEKRWRRISSQKSIL